jgi:nucleotide-binding universal stress UspA family protein
MRHLIATTDFSEVANNAVRYACHLAQDLDAQVTLLHSFIIPVTFSDTPMPIIPVDESRAVAEERMAAFASSLQQEFAGLSIRTKVMYGDIVDCLGELSEESAPLLVVMGNSGDETPLWMGSNLMNALKNLKLSVMGVPAGVSYSPVKNICLASDLKHVEQDIPVDRIRELRTVTGGTLHLLHINTGGKSTAADESGRSMLMKRLSPPEPTFHEVVNTDIEAGISEFVAANGMDWLVLIPHKYSLLEKIFHKSQTKAVARVSPVPVIAMHV